MLTLPESVRIYLASAPCDMRRGFDGLYSLVQHDLHHDVYSGHLYVFVSKRGDRIKILMWDCGGFVLWCKRLERGRFKIPVFEATTKIVSLDSGQLAMLLSGVDYSRVHRPKRWRPSSQNTLATAEVSKK